MTNPNISASTSIFNLSGDLNIDPLLNEAYQKWGGVLGTGANLSFSFPWTNSQMAYWQSNYSSNNEQLAAYHFGFNNTQIVAARNALQEWANVANLSFQEVSETDSDVGDFRFAFSSALPSNAWGWAGYPNNYWAAAADVWVNPTYASDMDWSAGTYHYEALMHEIGHGLGLKHPGNYGGSPAPYLPSYLDFRNYTIMSYNDTTNNWYWDSVKNIPVFVGRETPMAYDIYAIQYLYGANTSYHSGNDTYTFSPNNPFYKTIWDAGGNDTIDVSNFSLSNIIDLNGGSYSTISFSAPGSSWFNGANDLGIAFNVVIENAIGGSGNDTLIGNSADNVLDAGVGDDTLKGGLGNDELIGGKGFDRAYYDDATSSVTVNLATGASSGGAGNDTLNGIEGVMGSAFNDTLTGDKNANNLVGGAGNDRLNGGAGVDTMSGGLGNDSYIVDNTTDIIIENTAEGSDKISSSVTYTLAANVENLTLTGTSAINGTGNGLANVLTGNSAANQLNGGAGNDTLNGGGGNDTLNGGRGNDKLNSGTGTNTLTGGSGKDIFKFTTAGHIDKITDFSVVDDTIQLDKNVFTSLTSTRVLAANQFRIGSHASDANDYIIYNNATGALLYDADGSGVGIAVQIATVGVGLSMTNADIVVI
ncbi:M10 family metallopeptidase C-terminal domain-containing protein [Nitrosomonas sp. Nm33]|uniref:M10 family metallopeptidase C-terminal domain-containing protein n=1 Tax=Nitrosomonas sp. Nm33 TaxID=133724 RepID=UPI00089A0B04|nr:M10 family metallopeptidase C-terminal domain-containing protein [Nitrosomonas sp. Nm33]SDY83501.1 serralysin [Nitrosomonas sp. Nm33]